ncbi:hypothetical protein Y1Q_0013050 [Alligator mississippiensis]|uniref:Reverse transcriptase/retrotransposon-derived protein RNase H-like domain-containing protein n=1 Tax=Alligator mississippiensis TaxID=8496 RepID=A0A151N7H0_ALLMI|nr:hypothetical protein Y1Q_0013050 [Alligator mississippiensis]
MRDAMTQANTDLERGPNGRQQLSRAVPGIPLGLKGGSLVVKSPRATQPHPSMELRLIPAQRLVFSQTHRNFCRLVTNASETAVRAVLTQEEEGAERPVAYTSRKLLPAETRCTDEARTDDPKSQAEEITNLPGARGNEEACCKKLPKRFISRAHLQLGPGDAMRRHLLVKIKNQPKNCGSRPFANLEPDGVVVATDSQYLLQQLQRRNTCLRYGSY